MSDLFYSSIVRRKSSAIWTPDTPGAPERWRNVVAGRLYQDTGKTTPATNPGDPVACLVAMYGSDHVQSSLTLRPYLTTIGTGRLALRSDNVDDTIGNNDALSLGAKTYGILFRIYSAPGSTAAETIARVGFYPPGQLIVRHSGLSSTSAKGWHVACDRVSGSQPCIQGPSPALLSNAVHTLVIRYDGVAAATASSYRIWLDGVEQTATTGGNVAASGFGRWLATSVPAEVCDVAVAEDVLWTSALSESDCLSLVSYLEAQR